MFIEIGASHDKDAVDKINSEFMKAINCGDISINHAERKFILRNSKNETSEVNFDDIYLGNHQIILTLSHRFLNG